MRRREAFLFVALVAACVGCDHATKLAADDLLGPRVVSWAGDAVRFEMAWNRGGLLSLGAELPRPWRVALFGFGVPIVLLGVCGVAVRSVRETVPRVGLALVAGGGLGNWLDRMLNDGMVTDFVSLGVGPLRTGIFNVADVAIIGGIALVVITGGSGSRGGAEPLKAGDAGTHSSPSPESTKSTK